MAMAVQEIVALKKEFHGSYARLCETVGIAYPSFKRYKARIAQGQPVILVAGPKKIEPLRLEELMSDIRKLSHAQKRTRGTTALLARYSERISRREFNRTVRWVRFEISRENKAHLRRVSWKRPCLVWSMDEAELSCRGRKIRFHHVQDLGSRYKFTPVIAQKITQKQVAARLEELFKSHGAPLVLKRDNGAALNGQAVNAVLEKHLVIPLNSPAYYAPYNGGMERAQREIKESLRQKLSRLSRYEVSLLDTFAAQAAGELNHKSRRSLRGQTSCQVFQAGKVALKAYHRRKRKEVFDWVKTLAVKIAVAMKGGGKRHASTAWRLAVESWLQRNGVIAVSPRKSVTQFSDKNGS